MRTNTEARLLFGGTITNCVVGATWWLQPVLMQQLVSHRHYSDAAAGLVLTAEAGAMAAVAAFAAKPLAGVAQLGKIAFWGTLLAVMACAATLAVQDRLGWLLASRIVAGIGEGVVLTVYSRIGSQAADPSAMFAKIGFANVLFGIALMAAVPLVQPWAGSSAGYASLLIALACMLPWMGLLPSASTDGAGDASSAANAYGVRQRVRIGSIAASAFVIGLCSGAVWAFFALIGEQSGLSTEYVDATIGLSIFSSGAGVMLAAVIGSRLGYVAPMATGLSLMVAAVGALSQSPSPLTYRIGCTTLMAMVYFVVPILLGAASSEDKSGRGATYVTSAFFLSGAVSPLAGGLLIGAAGFRAVAFGTTIAAVAVIAVFVALARDHAAIATEAAR